MAFRFTRETILPLFLQSRLSVAEFARRAGVNPKTAERAVNGLPVSSSVIDKVACALGVDAMKFLVMPGTQQA